MPKPRALHDGLCAGAIAFFASYAAPFFVTLPQLWYAPIARAWSFGDKPAGLVMDWFGRTANATIAALLIGSLVGFLSRARLAPPHRAWSALMAVSLVTAMALYVGHLADRVPVPEPLPPGYVPR